MGELRAAADRRRGCGRERCSSARGAWLARVGAGFVPASRPRRAVGFPDAWSPAAPRGPLEGCRVRPSGKGALLSGPWPLGGALPHDWVSRSCRPRHPPGLGLPWDPASPPIPSRPPPPTSEVGRLRGQPGPLIVPFLLLHGRVSRRPLGPAGGKGARRWCLDAIAAGAGSSDKA